MSASLNKVTLIGNLGKDPEIRTTNDGREIANFSIATSESWKDKTTGDKKEKTEWHRIACFNEGLVRVMKNYVKKGSKIYIEGQLSTRKWTDKEGNDQYTTEVVLKGYNGVLILLGSNSNQSVEQGLNSPAQGNKPAFDNAMLDDEIPF